MLDAIVTQFIAQHPTAVVLDLGCGLDTRGHRLAPPAGVDWYDIDLPAVIKLREQLVPDERHVVAADLTKQGWLNGLPTDRPALALTDGLQALLTGPDFVAVTRMLTEHFDRGELTFNAYSRLALRNGRRARSSSVLSMPIEDEGI
jgi:O-methyltransferase involved in polyketide biosynthesis